MDEAHQWEAYFANSTDGGNHRQDDGWQGFIGPGLVVLTDTPTEPRAEEADEVTGHWAER